MADTEPKNPEEAELEDSRMSLLEHLSELRQRLRNAVIAFAVALIASFFLVNKFFVVLVKPVVEGMKDAGADTTLYTKSMTEGFWVMFKLAMVMGFVVAAPFVFWELWKFVAPGLYKKEKKVALLVTGATAGCFVVGAVFGWFVLARSATFYLTKILSEFSFGPLKVEPNYMVEETTNFLMLMLLGCGAAFELPVVLVVLGWMGVISARGMWRFNKYALVLSTVVGAVLTPSPDPLNQILMAAPLYVLYNLSIILVWMIEKGRKKKADDLEKQYGNGPEAPAAT